MGRLSHDSQKLHFSHPHPLELINFNTPTPNSLYCAACELQPSGWMYTCQPCNFTLHVSCTQMPQLITHPSHPHSLSLLFKPFYPSGLFSCDACGKKGRGFSYHCSSNNCDFDIHILCSIKPLLVHHHSHVHQLKLTFEPPYSSAKGFSCDICRKSGSNHWLYRCNSCEFDAHLDCATSAYHSSQNTITSKPSLQNHHGHHLQHYSSFPVAASTTNNNNIYQQQQQHATAAMVNNNKPNYHQLQTATSMPNIYPPSVPAAAMANNNNIQNYQQLPVTTTWPNNNQQQVQNANFNNNLMNAVVQGFVQGAAEQIGQTYMQSMMGNDGGGGGNNFDPAANGNEGGGGDASSEMGVDSSTGGGFGEAEML